MQKGKKDNYRTYHKKYEKRAKSIYFFALLLLPAEIAVCILFAGDAIVPGAVAGAGVLFIALIFLMQRNDDAYVSGIVTDISEVLDEIMKLEQREVFPVEEDSLVSKLQNQVLGITRILRLQNENERQEHENIKGLVSDLSHQLKTPLATLRIYVSFLEQEGLSDEERLKYVQILKQSLERLLFLSEGMIKVSRLESGLVSICRKDANINDTVLAAIKNIYGKAAEKQIEIRYAEEYRGTISHDVKWTSEAIFNLIENAVKYGKTGSHVLVSVRKLGASVEISVEDENPRIESGEYNLIFRRFYRGKNGAEAEGAGIGLYLTRDIIEKQGGYVSVKPGVRGNRFVIVMC